MNDDDDRSMVLAAYIAALVIGTVTGALMTIGAGLLTGRWVW